MLRLLRGDMTKITLNTTTGKRLQCRAEFVNSKALAAIDELNADIAIIDGTPTNQQMVQIMRRALVRQRKIINYIISLNA